MGASSSGRSDSKAELRTFRPGQFLHIEGVGSRWQGRHFGARVVDCRADDDTVKVQYLDGGYKRLRTSELLALVRQPSGFGVLESLKVGQHVNLAGTGKRWTGQICKARVLEVRKADATVKVEYIDGGFKRYCAAEFELILREHEPPMAWEQWQIGQHVYLRGNGKWWSGKNFGATIVDISLEDSTVKLRYTDGGFKRFDMDTFKSLVTKQPAAPEIWEEWHASAPQEKLSDMDQLHDEIMLATDRGDMQKASDLKQRFQEVSMHRDELRQLREDLLQAIQSGDYLKAHDLQQQLNQALGVPAGTLSAPSPLETPPSSSELMKVVQNSANRAFYGGVAGASAMVLQVTSLMWLRTTMNYQYRYGLSTREALATLYAQGGVARFYQGIGPALLQGPLTRFGDAAANAGVLAFFDGTDARHWPVWLKTIFASASAAMMRVALMPVDSVKTVMQVDGKQGLPMLMLRWRAGGVSVFYRGAVASSAATFVSHYPWFVVFNGLNDAWPNYEDRPRQLLRNAGIGFAASVCSDTVSNSLRVLKTHRQLGSQVSYMGIAQTVIQKDGALSLLSRGLCTRIAGNGISGMLFSVLYRLIEEPLVTR
eukprot:TRINITY_DN27791_c0_g1_i2.p1 TRINITY_DN27791_c0_g1~~TRINITY_DN27791_c0_g1_i2.p1  ORF type:complete len:597 (-),score=96.72 TRINITY_DN27791_c0_g1_i2:24-1814(-)